MRSHLEPIDEQDRIARNKPHPRIEKQYPKVTDGTTHSIIIKTPRRIIQQLPTGSVVGAGNDWLNIMAGFIFTEIILKNANSQFALLQKCWQTTEKALAHGGQFGLVQFVNRGQYFGTDVTIPYVKDVLYESGKVSDLDSNVIFLRAWYQPRDIEAIIRREERLQKLAKERGEKYTSVWDLRELAKIKDQVVAKKDDETSKYNKSTDNAHKGGVPVIHAFQRGIGGEFYSFHQETKNLVRTKLNKDPRGEIPGSTMYFGSDGANPVGRSLIESVGPLQNLIDSDMQMYQFERALMLAPPTIKKGNWNKSQAKLIPNAIVDLGTDSNASWEVLKRDTSALNQFAQNYGLMKSQLLNVASSPDTSISSTVGNPGFSKTPQGVQAVQANVSVDDNHVRKQFETWFENIAETMVNLYFAERTGIEDIQVDKDTASQLRKINPELVSDDGKVRIDFDTATEQLKFEVDASTSNMKDNAQQLDALDGLLTRLEKSTVLQQYIPPQKVIGAWNSIVAASGVENPEELTVSDDELQQIQDEQAAAQQQQVLAEQQAQAQQQMQPQQVQAPQQMQEQQQMQPQNMQPAMPQEMGQAAPGDMPGQAMGAPVEQPPELSPEDQQFAFALQDMGYSPEQISIALEMEVQGVPNEQIIQALEAM
jgi:hypothetical protein